MIRDLQVSMLCRKSNFLFYDTFTTDRMTRLVSLSESNTESREDSGIFFFQRESQKGGTCFSFCVKTRDGIL